VTRSVKHDVMPVYWQLSSNGSGNCLFECTNSAPLDFKLDCIMYEETGSPTPRIMNGVLSHVSLEHYIWGVVARVGFGDIAKSLEIRFQVLTRGCKGGRSTSLGNSGALPRVCWYQKCVV